MAENTSVLGKITRFLIIGGAVILFILLVFLIVRLVPIAISGIANISSSISGRSGDKIEVSFNRDEVLNEEPFIVSWNYSPEEAGDYYIQYSCENSLLFDIQSRSGPKRILCNTNFKLGDSLDSISLIPILSKSNSFSDAEIEISYKNIDGDKVASGDSAITIKNTSSVMSTNNEFNARQEDFTESTVESKPVENQSVTTNLATPVVAPSLADLQISNIINLGNSRLSFIVRNIGGRTSGNWFFSYTDTENPNRTLTSPIQSSLGPGQGLFITVTFDGQGMSPQLINIRVDSTNSVAESNEFNNNSSVFVTGSRTGGSYFGGKYNQRDDADFVIDDMEVGRISNSRFIEDDDIDDGDKAAVRFVIRNQGSETTNDWRFRIFNTPYNDQNDYRSREQNRLRPGETREFIIEFENADEGTYNIRVEVDYDDDTDEENERNNEKSRRLRVRD